MMGERRQYQFSDKDIKVIENALLKHMHFLQLHGDPETSQYVYNLVAEINNQKRENFC